jgi:hypothetical protein
VARLSEEIRARRAAARGAAGLCVLRAIDRGRNGSLAQQKIDAADDGGSPEGEWQNGLRTAGNRGTERRWGDDSDRES